MQGVHRPAPFIVGAPRSGTTMLRLMLDAHPDLAIPAETGFFMTLAAAQDEGTLPDSANAFLRLLTGTGTWSGLNVGREELAQALQKLPDFTLGEGLRAFYRLYAAKHGKTRWGDKSPLHCLHLPLISETLPEAHIIHIIRDGRDVAVSLREVWFSPGNDPDVLANYWATTVQTARAAAGRCSHYLEVRYESLVTAPRQTLETICEYLDLPSSDDMLRYHERALTRLSEAGDFVQPDGSVITLAQRLYQQRFTSSPPDEGRIGRWREKLTPPEIARFEEVAGPLLRELGYAQE